MKFIMFSFSWNYWSKTLCHTAQLHYVRPQGNNAGFTMFSQQTCVSVKLCVAESVPVLALFKFCLLLLHHLRDDVWGQSPPLTTGPHAVQQPRKWDGRSAERDIASLLLEMSKTKQFVSHKTTSLKRVMEWQESGWRTQIERREFKGSRKKTGQICCFRWFA